VRPPKLHFESRISKILFARRRLMLSVMAGLVLLAVLPGSMRMGTRLLLAWDLTAALYVGFALRLMLRSDIDYCRARAALYDESDWVIMSLVVVSSASSFAAIFVELAATKSGGTSMLLGLSVTGLTVALSWAFTHVVFTLHYANVYYRPHHDGTHAHRDGGLDFPGKEAPNYRDFLYYSFVIGCAAQTGDIATTCNEMRMISLVHGIIAFSFNTAILALCINVGASLM
jgi:uncharacterized membrane protein